MTEATLTRVIRVLPNTTNTIMNQIKLRCDIWPKPLSLELLEFCQIQFHASQIYNGKNT